MSNTYIAKIVLILIMIAALTPRISFAATVSDAATVSVSATVGAATNTPSGSGGGGGGDIAFLTSVTFSGSAYPKAVVHIWKDGTLKGTTIANSKGYFSETFNESYNPSALYTLYAIDAENRRSALLNYPVVIKSGYITQISGIRFAPTVALDRTEVKAGDYLTIYGYALPLAPLDIVIEGSIEKAFYLTSASSGKYLITVPLTDLRKGDYILSVKYHDDSKISKLVKFTIGDVNIPSIELVANIPGDCNADQIINLVDFSVAAFWYGKDNPPRCIDTNNDKNINLVDFSILAFYWTG